MTIPDRIWKASPPKGGCYRWPIVKTVTGTDQAANTECTDTVPAGKLWLLRAYSVSLAQGATQTPWPSLTVQNVATTTLYTFLGGSEDLDASITATYIWSIGAPLSLASALTVVTAPIPADILLPEGYKLVTATDGIGANSNYGVPSIEVYEYSVDG